MSGQFDREMGMLADYWLFKVGPEVAECKYCCREFRPRLVPPTKDQTFGHYQKFCSALCYRLWREEQREEG